jgi:hypothetical protein
MIKVSKHSDLVAVTFFKSHRRITHFPTSCPFHVMKSDTHIDHSISNDVLWNISLCKIDKCGENSNLFH